MNWKKVLTLTCLVLMFTTALLAAEKDPQLIISAGKGGFLLTSPDGDFQFRVRGYLQLDGRFFFDQNTSVIDTFVLRRVRPIFEGTVYKYFDFKIMPDFGNGVTVLQDAYLDAKFSPKFKIRFGKTKPPFGLERLQSATDLTFVERSLATNLVPNRDLGIYAFGDLVRDKISYAAGIMNGVVDLGNSDLDSGGDSKDFVGRIFVRPVKELGVGVAITEGNQDGTLLAPNLPTYRTAGQLVIFRYRLGATADVSTIANGRRLRFSPQATFYKGPFGVLTEYVSSSQEVINGTHTADLRQEAWNITANYILTGEHASYKGVDPQHPFDLENRALGAWEVAFRYSQLQIDNDAFPIFADPLTAASEAKNWTVGLNWYLNKNVKFAFSYDNTTFQDANIKTEKLFQTRFQIAF
jgi:phosphate-selective porin OprO and OprP